MLFAAFEVSERLTRFFPLLRRTNVPGRSNCSAWPATARTTRYPLCILPRRSMVIKEQEEEEEEEEEE
jgi:hypothetical protein